MLTNEERRKKGYTRTIGLKWLYLTEVIKGLPIFNFTVLIRKHIQYADIGVNNKWISVFNIESQEVEKLLK